MGRKLVSGNHTGWPTRTFCPKSTERPKTLPIGFFMDKAERLGRHGVWFYFLNLTGSLGVMLIARHKRVAQQVVIHTFTTTVALTAIDARVPGAGWLDASLVCYGGTHRSGEPAT